MLWQSQKGSSTRAAVAAVVAVVDRVIYSRRTIASHTITTLVIRAKKTLHPKGSLLNYHPNSGLHPASRGGKRIGGAGCVAHGAASPMAPWERVAHLRL